MQGEDAWEQRQVRDREGLVKARQQLQELMKAVEPLEEPQAWEDRLDESWDHSWGWIKGTVDGDFRLKNNEPQPFESMQVNRYRGCSACPCSPPHKIIVRMLRLLSFSLCAHQVRLEKQLQANPLDYEHKPFSEKTQVRDTREDMYSQRTAMILR